MEIKKLFNYVILILCVSGNFVYASEKNAIIAMSVQEQIGFKEAPVIHVELALKKACDLHVSILNTDGWQRVKKTMKRIKKSGKYHFVVPIKDLKPGSYRVDAYISPKGKDWSKRIGETLHRNLLVINKPKYIAKYKLSHRDLIRKINWPEQIVDNKEQILTVLFNIKEKRYLHIKLLSSENWQEFGAIKIPVKESGEVSLPFSDMINNFNQGKYVWLVYLTEVDNEKPLIKEIGKHFKIVKD